MPNSKLRRQIALEAARLIFERLEPDCYRAKSAAIDAIGNGYMRPSDIPTDTEIRQRIRKLAKKKPDERKNGELRKMMAAAKSETDLDRFQIYEALLLPLENVGQNLKYHPEGDALYHSLQVFDHARDELPYDEEFLAAALLHDVGKGIDPGDHVAAALEALDGAISARTAWLIENHMHSHGIADRTLGRRAHRRLRESEFYDDLVLLGECDRAGRQAGVEAPELEEALDYLRDLTRMCG